jgi:hypothetical protein
MAILDFNGLVCKFGPAAVKMSLNEQKGDDLAIASVRDRTSESRIPTVRRWLESYDVFQGFDANQRNAISTAFLDWADAQQSESSLATLNLLISAHASLEQACVAAYGKQRDFASLASKALWLRYPIEAPLFDSFALGSLYILSKLEEGIPEIPVGGSPYARFAFIWLTLYARYSSAISEVPNQGYPYRVRIFDRILWLLGAPYYKL